MKISSRMMGNARERVLIHRVGMREPQQHRLQRQQTAGLQRITLQRHRQREDELQQDEPRRDRRAVLAAQPHHERIEQQEAEDGQLVPAWRVPQEQIAERVQHEPRLRPEPRPAVPQLLPAPASSRATPVV